MSSQSNQTTDPVALAHLLWPDVVLYPAQKAAIRESMKQAGGFLIKAARKTLRQWNSVTAGKQPPTETPTMATYQVDPHWLAIQQLLTDKLNAMEKNEGELALDLECTKACVELYNLRGQPHPSEYGLHMSVHRQEIQLADLRNELKCWKERLDLVALAAKGWTKRPGSYKPEHVAVLQDARMAYDKSTSKLMQFAERYGRKQAELIEQQVLRMAGRPYSETLKMLESGELKLERICISSEVQATLQLRDAHDNIIASELEEKLVLVGVDMGAGKSEQLDSVVIVNQDGSVELPKELQGE